MKSMKAGQAMVEFLCGLVGIVVIITMMLQISLISSGHTVKVVDARSELADVLASYGSYYEDGDYLSDWDSGADQYNYSEDDIRKEGQAGWLTAVLGDAVSIEKLESYVGFTNGFSEVCGSYESEVVRSMGTTKVTGMTDPILILPGVKRLVYNRDEIVLRHEIYMPLINNLAD